jgi:uncharacterized membrane protein
MIVLLVLAVAWTLARLLGCAGIAVLDTWRKALPYGLAVMFLFTAAAHFTSMRADMVRMVPEWMPNPEATVFVTGILEVLGAIGLMIPRTRRAAAIGLILFLIAAFPANIRAAREQLPLGGRAATPLAIRLPMQLLFIGLLWVGGVRNAGTRPEMGTATRG